MSIVYVPNISKNRMDQTDRYLVNSNQFVFICLEYQLQSIVISDKYKSYFINIIHIIPTKFCIYICTFNLLIQEPIWQRTIKSVLVDVKYTLLKQKFISFTREADFQHMPRWGTRLFKVESRFKSLDFLRRPRKCEKSTLSSK